MPVSADADDMNLLIANQEEIAFLNTLQSWQLRGWQYSRS